MHNDESSPAIGITMADGICTALLGSNVKDTAHSIMRDAKEMTSVSSALGPIRRLYCTCCGESFYGRQFHNQDIGHGMGPCCADHVLNHRPFGRESMGLAEFERTYGNRGVHFDISQYPSDVSGFDYTHQAWVVDGKYVACGHLQTTPCECYGRLHEGESPARDAEIH